MRCIAKQRMRDERRAVGWRRAGAHRDVDARRRGSTNRIIETQIDDQVGIPRGHPGEPRPIMTDPNVSER